MYCIHCGVELADSEKKCPLCKTRVYHPDLKPAEGEAPYPPTADDEGKFNPIGILFVITVLLFLTPSILTLLIDFRVNARIDWSGYVTGALVCLYVATVLPAWFRRPNPVIFLPCAFAAVALYLFYINFSLCENWFFTLALPLTFGLALVLTAVVALIRYVRGGYLYIFGGAILFLGALTVLLELLINLTFSFPRFSFWSIYPLCGSFLLGMLLILIAICRPLRESLQKKFFL
jgi:hypothetical protein